MANEVSKLTIDGTTYTIIDGTALHSSDVDLTLSAYSNNPIANSAVVQGLSDTLVEAMNGPYLMYVLAGGILLKNFTSIPTTLSDLLDLDEFQTALRKPILITTGVNDTTTVTQGILCYGMNGEWENGEWTILFPDAITYNGVLVNGVTGTLMYNSEWLMWMLGNVQFHTPGFKTYTDDALSTASSQITAALNTKLDTTGTSYRTSGIPYGQCDGTSTSTAFTATVPGITELRDGVCMWLKNGVVDSAAGFTINVNGLGAKPSYNNMANATRDETLFKSAYTFLFVYDSTRTSGGCWVCYRGYNSNDNTIGYQLRTNSMSLASSGQVGRYRLLFTSADGTKWVPANTSSNTSATTAKTVNQTAIDPFGDIRYYSSTTVVSSGNRPGTSSLWEQYSFTLGYSFNKTGAALTLTSWMPVYVKCAPQSDGSAIIDSDAPYTQTLPSTEDGKIYIFLGIAYSATAVELLPHHPVYYYKDSAIRLWTNNATSSGTVTGSGFNGYLAKWTGNDGETVNALTVGPSFSSVETGKFLRDDGTWQVPPEPSSMSATAITKTGNTTNGLSAVVEPMVNATRSNKTFGIPGEAITIEYSTDNGVTWTGYPSDSTGLPNVNKQQIFMGIATKYMYLGGPSHNSESTATADDQVRVTIFAKDRYVRTNALYVYKSGNDNVNRVLCKMETATRADPTTWTTVFEDKLIQGNSGPNWIYYNPTVFGGVNGNTSNIHYYRLTFYKDQTGSYTNTTHVSIQDIRFYGDTVWGTKGSDETVANSSVVNMLKYDVPYKWDASMTVEFPGSVKGLVFYQTLSSAASDLYVYRTPYTTVGNGADVGAKTATVLGFKKYAGSRVAVKFTYGNNASTPTLNVQNSGAANITYRGVNIGTSGTAYKIPAGAILELMYDGSTWAIISGYEAMRDEGTFTISDAASGGSSDTWSYYKSGKEVTVSGQYTGTSTTAIALYGLPFTAKYSKAEWLPVLSGINFMECRIGIAAGETQLQVYGNPSSATYAWLQAAKAANQVITFTYLTDD